MNVFQSTYEHRLREWRELRQRILTLDTSDRCIEVDRWWQQTPTITRHLHWSDQENWPDPWDMLSENTYCSLTRAIGMCYTLLLAGEQDIELALATDANCEEHTLVLVDGAKYILSYWPNTVISNSLQDFTVLRRTAVDMLSNRIK